MPHLPIEMPSRRQPHLLPGAEEAGTDPSTTSADLDHDGTALLDLLRREAAACRSMARLDLDDAPAITGGTCSTGLRFLLRVLPQALGTRPVIYFPGTRIVSFDERWLLAVIAARRRNDRDSLAFLLRRRIPTAQLRMVIRLLPDSDIHTAKGILSA